MEPLRERVAFLRHLAPTRQTEWVVYAKRPFAGPEQVLDYVGRYTHRVAISNNRLLDIDRSKVTFRYKDYRHDSQQKTMTLDAEEFIRRFLLHVLPGGFQRIRYYGFLGNRYRKEKLARCRQLLGMPACEAPTPESSQDYRDRCEELTGSSLRECPVCHQGRMTGWPSCRPAPAGRRQSWTAHDTYSRKSRHPAADQLAWSSQRGSVATVVTTPIRRQIEGIPRATHTLSLAAPNGPQPFPRIAAGRFSLPASPRAPIKTPKAGILPRFSPIHF